MKTQVIIMAAAGIMMLAGCKEKKQTNDIIAIKQEVRKPQAPIRMQDVAHEQPVAWNGKNYLVRIERVASDSLPMVKDEIGQKYVDNRVSLQINRQDGSVFFQKTLTKEAFLSYIDEEYQRQGILEALVFVEAKGNELQFALSISKPQSDDEFIPLLLSVNAQGNTSIRRDTEIDTGSNVYDEQ